MKNKFLEIRAKIRNIKDFPIDGVDFKDITPVLEDSRLFKFLIDELVSRFKNKKITKVVGIESRGFLLASVVAYALGAGMVIVRKRGKLPYKTLIREHDLEYGSGSLEINIDAIKKGERVIIIDDLLATGGTAGAAVALVETLKGEVMGLGFLLELKKFKGRKKLKKYDIESLIRL
ncbi:MAG TPA: adenine phosphoribosyltransferase [Candidatus Paceibacterota bacterium]